VSTQRKLFSFSTLALAAALTACGGGGSDTPSSTSSSPAPATGTSAPIADAPVASTPPALSAPVVVAPDPVVVAPDPVAVAPTPVVVTPPPVAVAPTPSAAPVKVGITRLSLTRKDILARTAGNTTVASAFFDTITTAFYKLMSPIMGDALADDRPKLNHGSNHGFTNKLVNGKLTSLGAQLTTKSNATLNCNTSNTEVVVEKIWTLDPVKGHMLAKMQVPDTVDKDCNVTFRTGEFVIAGDGTVFDTTVTADSITTVIPAGDEAFNTSQSAVLIYAGGQIRVLDVSDNYTATLTDLTSLDAKVKTGNGSIAYNGQYLVGTSADRAFVGVLVYEKGSTGFKMVRNSAVSTSFTWGNFVDADGTIKSNQNDGVHIIDPKTGASTLWTAAPKFSYGVSDPVTGTYAMYKDGVFFQTLAPTSGTGGFAMPKWTSEPGYGHAGRSGSTWMSTRCTLWNSATGETTYLQHVAGQVTSADVYGSQNPQYAKLYNGQATCVNQSMNEFTKYDVKAKTFRYFNTDALGLFPKAFTMFDTTAMIEVVNTKNSDRMYVELNFETGEVANRGVISVGTRVVVDLVPFGN
jgi:hypothetical protein